MRHLLLDITAHGLGHLAQLSPVMAALAQGWEPVRLTVRSGHSRGVLARFLPEPFATAPPVPDLGMAMHDPNRVDVAASRRFYVDLHADWDSRVAGEALRLSALAPDLLLANVPYLSLAAAARAGVPAMALCSLNWHAIAAAYFQDMPEMAPVLDQVLAAYHQARPFLRVLPALPMADLPDAVPIGPVARLGRDRRAELRQGWPGDGVPGDPGPRLVLVSFGGIAGAPLLSHLPRLPGVAWITGDDRVDRQGRPDIRTVAEVGLPFIDLVRSVDLVVTKPGYGLFADAVCNGTRLAWFGRPDWPETPHLAAWAGAHGAAWRIPDAAVGGPALADNVQAALDMPAPAEPPAATGAGEAARIIAAALGLTPR